MVLHPEEMLVAERAGLVAYCLARGEALTIEQVRDMAGYQRNREARRLLQRLARVIPIYQQNGQWEVCEMQEKA